MDNKAAEIKKYIDDGGGRYREWYVGIAADARKRLFTDHGVREKGDMWIFRTFASADDARKVEDYFVNTLGTDGGPGGGDDDSKSVYAYHKEAHTTQ
jgi:hypothetical protein